MDRKRARLGIIVVGFASLLCANAYAGSHYGAPPQCSGTSPASNEAYLWTGQNYSGTCYVLSMMANGTTESSDGWISWDASSQFPNDDIESVWVGSNSKLVLFWNSFNTADSSAPLPFNSGDKYGSLGSWNNQVSAARLQNWTYANCAGSNRINIWQDANYGGDCTQLDPWHGAPNSGNRGMFENPTVMGFRNDTMTAVKSIATTLVVHLWSNTYVGGWSGTYLAISTGSSYPDVSSYGFNDVMSGMCSVGLGNECR
jgi:hypothetical protein